MYKPFLNTGKNRIPILSRDEIDDIAEKYLKEYQPEALKKPMAIDIEGFAENYLGAIPDYQYLSHNMVYLGMTIFHDSDYVIVFDPQVNEAKYISARARTIIIDMRLLEKIQEHRYRFTLGHECGHLIFHKPYFEYLRRMTKISEEENVFQIGYLKTIMSCDSIKSQKTSIDWIEWQANQFASAILMPKSVVYSIVSNYSVDSNGIKNVANDMKAIFNVSYEAVMNRLKNLGFVDIFLQMK